MSLNPTLDRNNRSSPLNSTTSVSQLNQGHDRQLNQGYDRDKKIQKSSSQTEEEANREILSSFADKPPAYVYFAVLG